MPSNTHTHTVYTAYLWTFAFSSSPSQVFPGRPLAQWVAPLQLPGGHDTRTANQNVVNDTRRHTHIIGSLTAFGFRYLSLKSKTVLYCIEGVQSVEAANNQKHSYQKTFQSFDL